MSWFGQFLPHFMNFKTFIPNFWPKSCESTFKMNFNYCTDVNRPEIRTIIRSLHLGSSCGGMLFLNLPAKFFVNMEASKFVGVIFKILVTPYSLIHTSLLLFFLVTTYVLLPNGLPSCTIGSIFTWSSITHF